MKIIVGDRFISFCKETDNIIYSEFIKSPQKLSKTSLIIGLGLSQNELKAIQKISDKYQIKLFFKNSPADCCITHKYKEKNCLISKPVQISENTYEASLILDDESELLSDHITGLHLQGMILIEACRQMFISVAMDYFSKNFFSNERYGAINSMDSQFESYTFPIPALIRYTRTALENNTERDNVSFSGKIEIIQAGRRYFQMSMKHTYYKLEKIQPIEKYKCQSACKRLVESITPEKSNEKILIL